MGAGNSKKEEPVKQEIVQNTYDEKRRTNVAKEVVETEKTYVKHLETLCKVFIAPLKEASETDHPILSSNDIKVLGELDERMKKWDSSTCLGDIFAKNNAFFKMISTYVNGYNQALLTYMQCKQRDKPFAQFLDKIVTSGITNLMDLQSYLIMPVQRLPRYVMLLTELVKYSNPKHPGYPSLCRSLEAVKGVAEFVNEAKRNAENSLKMLQIQEILPTRKYYGEGNFTWLNSRKKEPRPLQYFLFHDSILLATPEKSFFQSTPDKLKLKILTPLVSVELQETNDSEGKGISKFDIQTPSKVFTVVCDQGVDMDDWIKTFYWLKSGCGPRYEKVNAEAQKRHYIKADEHMHPNSKKETKPEVVTAKPAQITKSDSKANVKSDSKTDLKAEVKVDPKSDPKASPKVEPPKVDPKVNPKAEPKADAKPIPKVEPPKVDPKASPKVDPKANPKIDPPKADPKASPKVDPKASPKVDPKSDQEKGGLKGSSDAVSKSAPKPAAPSKDGKDLKSSKELKDPKGSASPPPPPSAKGKGGETSDPNKPKPPRPKSPPTPRKDAAKKSAPLSSSSSSSSSPPGAAMERRPSLTTSLSAFFGIGGPTTAPPPSSTPSPSSSSSNSNAKGESSPASPRTAKPPPAKPPASSAKK